MTDQERFQQIQREVQARCAERQAERELALRLIAIGSRQLMKEAHPKLASSKETVKRIKRVRKTLKACSLCQP